MESGRMSANTDAVYICQRVSHSISAQCLFVCVQKNRAFLACVRFVSCFCFLGCFFARFVCLKLVGCLFGLACVFFKQSARVLFALLRFDLCSCCVRCVCLSVSLFVCLFVNLFSFVVFSFVLLFV